MVNTLIVSALIASLVGMVVFLGVFSYYSPHWRASALGRHMVYFAAAFSMALSTNLLRIIISGGIIDTIRIISLFLLAAVTWQRVWIMVRSIRRSDAE